MPNVEVTKQVLKDIFYNVNTMWIFDKMVADIINLVDDKNKAYGDAWQRYGIFTPLIRINDKILRLKTLSLHAEYGALIPDENIQDTLKDIIGYALLALLWIKMNKELNVASEYTGSDKSINTRDAMQQVAKHVAK